MKISEIVFRKDLYPRFEPSQPTIKKYSESIDKLPPIKVNQLNILIDGFHRWKAHLLVGETEIKAEVIETESEAELKRLAYQTNSNHGLQLTNAEKKQYALEMIEISSIAEISETISVSEQSIANWTKDKRKSLEEKRNRLILSKYLHGNETEQSVADEFGLTQKAINKFLSTFTKNSESTKNPFLYNIWNTTKGNDTEHFGSFPLVFMENLLHYHTKPMDIVFDPFAGNGTTVDACKKLTRRFYCSDLEVKAGREEDILFHDISNGLPEDLKKPDLVFLDPPYWRQASGKYTEHENQFGDMSLEDFNNGMRNLFAELKKRKVQRIAIVISPTQWPSDDHRFIDHTLEFHTMISKWYDVEQRYLLPYSSQQYNGTQVEIAKKENICLSLIRDLTVWKMK